MTKVPIFVLEIVSQTMDNLYVELVHLVGKDANDKECTLF